MPAQKVTEPKHLLEGTSECIFCMISGGMDGGHGNKGAHGQSSLADFIRFLFKEKCVSRFRGQQVGCEAADSQQT